MKPDETLALAVKTAKAIETHASVHPRRRERAFELGCAGIERLAKAFLELRAEIFSPPAIGDLRPRDSRSQQEKLRQLAQTGASLVGAVLVALDQLAPLPPPGDPGPPRRVNGAGG